MSCTSLEINCAPYSVTISLGIPLFWGEKDGLGFVGAPACSLTGSAPSRPLPGSSAARSAPSAPLLGFSPPFISPRASCPAPALRPFPAASAFFLDSLRSGSPSLQWLGLILRPHIWKTMRNYSHPLSLRMQQQESVHPRQSSSRNLMKFLKFPSPHPPEEGNNHFSRKRPSRPVHWPLAFTQISSKMGGTQLKWDYTRKNSNKIMWKGLLQLSVRIKRGQEPYL